MFIMMSMCNTIYLMLIKKCVCQHHEVLTMNKLSIKRTTNSAQMMKILNKIINVIAVLQLNSKIIIENNV